MRKSKEWGGRLWTHLGFLVEVLVVHGRAIWRITLLPGQIVRIVLLHVRLAYIAHIHKILMDLFVFLEGRREVVYMLDGLRRSFGYL
jgi:hypothetical protein